VVAEVVLVLLLDGDLDGVVERLGCLMPVGVGLGLVIDNMNSLDCCCCCCYTKLVHILVQYINHERLPHTLPQLSKIFVANN